MPAGTQIVKQHLHQKFHIMPLASGRISLQNMFPLIHEHQQHLQRYLQLFNIQKRSLLVLYFGVHIYYRQVLGYPSKLQVS